LPAAWFSGPEVETSDDDIEALRQEVIALREAWMLLGTSWSADVRRITGTDGVA
jgi:hypothetical protein